MARLEQQPRIEKLTEKKLIGKRLKMTFSSNKTFELWKSFMPQREEIENAISSDLFSMQVFDSSMTLVDISSDMPFEKWAAIEVSDFYKVPVNMETFILPAGLYAVFIYRGRQCQGDSTFSWIFSKWLPDSGYIIDNRPQFEILGDKYKNDDPDSEEEIWIPIRPR
jgi:AraC family transcriptional regulator